MRAGIGSSVLTHVVVLVLAQFGLPGTCTQPEVAAQYVPVELVSEQQLASLIERSDVAETPPQPTPQPQPEVVEPPEPPEPEIVEAPQPPEPPEPEVVEPPVPDIVETPELPPDPPAQDVVTLPPEPEEALPDIRPERRPEPPPRPETVEIAEETLDGIEEPPRDPDIRSVIRDLAETEDAVIETEVEPTVDQSELVAAAPAQQATRSEIDALKRMIVDQISKCWAPPIGAPNAEDLSVQIRVSLNSTGGVDAVSVVDRDRMATDRYFRAAAEAATRAILNDRCNPLALPADKYELWKDIRFTFNPADMFG